MVNINASSTSTGALGVGAVGVGTTLGTITAGSSLDNVIITTTTGELNVGAITATGASLVSYSVTTGANTAANNYGQLNVGPGSIASYSINAGASTAANEYGALTAGSITAMSITTGNGGGSHTFNSLAGVGSIGSLTVDADDNVTFTTGATGATSVGNINVDVLAGAAVALGTFGAAGGTLSDITVTGAGTFSIASGAVLTVGNVDTSAMTGGTATVTLSNSTRNGQLLCI